LIKDAFTGPIVRVFGIASIFFANSVFLKSVELLIVIDELSLPMLSEEALIVTVELAFPIKILLILVGVIRDIPIYIILPDVPPIVTQLALLVPKHNTFARKEPLGIVSK